MKKRRSMRELVRVLNGVSLPKGHDLLWVRLYQFEPRGIEPFEAAMKLTPT